MLGVKVDGPSPMFIDNQSVVWNATLPSSTLKKKHHSVAYHKVREAVASGIIKVAHIPSKDNIADILTKPVSPAVYWHLLRDVMYGKDVTQEHGIQGELQDNDVGYTIIADEDLAKELRNESQSQERGRDARIPIDTAKSSDV